MLVQDLTPETGRTLESIRRLVKEELNIDVEWKVIELRSDGEALVEVENFDHKIDIICKRHRFKRVYELYFVDNQTEREREVQASLVAYASREREKGNETMVQYMKVKVGKVWMRWSEERFRLEYDRRSNQQSQSLGRK